MLSLPKYLTWCSQCYWHISSRCVTMVIFLICSISDLFYLLQLVSFLFSNCHCNYHILSVVKIVCHFRNLSIVSVTMLMINEILIEGMFHGIVSIILHDYACVDSFGPTGGMQEYHITHKDWFEWCVSSCFSGYVYFSTMTYTLWTAIISFSLTEGMEYCPMLQFHVSWCLIPFFSNLNPWQQELILVFFKLMIFQRNCIPLLMQISHHIIYNTTQVLDVYLYDICNSMVASNIDNTIFQYMLFFHSSPLQLDILSPFFPNVIQTSSISSFYACFCSQFLLCLLLVFCLVP